MSAEDVYKRQEYDLLGMPITPELFLAFVDTVQRVPRIIIIDDNSVKRMNSKQTVSYTHLAVSG